MNQDERHQLFFVAWQGASMPEDWKKPDVLMKLEEKGFIQKKGEGHEATPQGRASLSPMAQAACARPRNYAELAASDQWATDRRLGILDWDGN